MVNVWLMVVNGLLNRFPARHGGTPKTLDGLFHGPSYKNGWFWGTPILGNLHIPRLFMMRMNRYDNKHHFTSFKSHGFHCLNFHDSFPILNGWSQNIFDDLWFMLKTHGFLLRKKLCGWCEWHQSPSLMSFLNEFCERPLRGNKPLLRQIRLPMLWGEQRANIEKGDAVKSDTEL